jgi:hypothetical protein
MNCKPGDLARIKKPYRDSTVIDLYVKVVRASAPMERIVAKNGSVTTHLETHLAGWLCEANKESFPRVIADCSLEPIRDQPGNESFVTKARKTLPRPTPVTGPVTINARGEPA